jgi:hypothetical protein
MRAAKRIGSETFVEYSNASPKEYVLNIEPCTVKAGTKWSGLWHIDVLLNNDYVNHYGEMDTVFLSSDQGLEGVPDNGQVLFQALDPELHKRTNGEPKYDFVLCGSMGSGTYQARSEAVEELKKEFTYKDYQHGHPPEVYVENVSNAKVQFIRTGEGGGKGALAQRFFEGLGMGPVLTNWTDDLPLTGLVEDVDYMAYRDHKEMMKKMHMLIDDKDLRGKIAYNGRRKALMYHSYEQRLMAIYNVVKDYENKM